jgi:nicotinamide mononucleotide adenylyltransferase|tara:strand:- start:285 stop:638 length:354 start_codon:yes stop_codon:yes gene_type:complete
MVSKNRYSFYIGRFQPFHDGHEWCVRQMLGEGKRVCIAIMDIHDDEPENNPFPTESVRKSIILRFFDEVNVGDIEVIVIPPIESVNYGRDVGYDLNELIPPDDIKEISATRIREEKR